MAKGKSEDRRRERIRKAIDKLEAELAEMGGPPPEADEGPRLDGRGLPAGEFKRLTQPLLGRVSKERPLYVRMLTLGRGVQDFVVEEVTAKGVMLLPPWEDEHQVYHIGERGRSYDVYVHRQLGTRHAVVYEGAPTPPTHLTEGGWRDSDPAADASFTKLLASYDAARALLNIEEPFPPWFWVLTALAFTPWAYFFVRMFLLGL